MTLLEWLKVKKILCIMAAQQGCTMKQIRDEIQACIDEAWDSAWTPGNLHAQIKWQQLFPGGNKPTVEEFVVVMAQEITNDETIPNQLK